MQPLNNPAHDSASAMANARWHSGDSQDAPTQPHVSSHARNLARLRWGTARAGAAHDAQPHVHQPAVTVPATGGGVLPWLALGGSGLAFILAGMERKQSEGGRISGTAVVLYIVAGLLFALAIYLFTRG
ncbi:MAG: DUF4199 domain-containing protein [Terriglobales bacterium]